MELIKSENLKNVQTCKIVHKKSGLFYNGYDEHNQSKGKNTLSLTSYKRYLIFNKNDDEILAQAFEGHIIIRNDGIKYMRNVIVYTGSGIHEILDKYYQNYDYLPVADFCVEKL